MAFSTVKFVENTGSGDQHVDGQTLNGGTGKVPLTLCVDRVLDFGGSSTGNVYDKKNNSNSGSWSAEVTVEGCQNVSVKSEFEKSNANCVLRVFLKDANATPGWTCYEEDINCHAQNAQDGTNMPTLVANYYLGRRVIIRTHGAKAIKFYLVSVSSGKVSVWARGA